MISATKKIKLDINEATKEQFSKAKEIYEFMYKVRFKNACIPEITYLKLFKKLKSSYKVNENEKGR